MSQAERNDLLGGERLAVFELCKALCIGKSDWSRIGALSIQPVPSELSEPHQQHAYLRLIDRGDICL
jgi:hypothetical protein